MQLKEVHEFAYNQLGDCEIFFTSMDNSGHRVHDKIINIANLDVSLLSEEAQKFTKKHTVQNIATWHLRKAQLTGFAEDEETLIHFFVEMLELFGETKFKELRQLSRVTRRSKLINLLKPELIATAKDYRSFDLEMFNDLQHTTTEKRIKYLSKDELVDLILEFEEKDRERLMADSGDYMNNDDNSANSLRQVLRLNKEYDKVREKLVKAMKKYEGGVENDNAKDRKALDLAFAEFDEIDELKLTPAGRTQYEEVKKNYNHCMNKITNGGAEFKLTAEAKRKFCIAYTRLEHICFMIYEAGLLCEEDERKNIVKHYLNNSEVDVPDGKLDEKVKEYTADADADKFQTAFNFVEENIPAVAFFFRRIYCDLRLAIEPIRQLHEGYLQPLIDSLPKIAAVLEYYEKPEIFTDVMTTIGSSLHLTENVPKVWHYMGKTCKRTYANDLPGELVNAQTSKMCDSSGFKTSGKIVQEASKLRQFRSILRDLNDDLFNGSFSDCEGKELCELDRLHNRYKGQRFKPTIDAFRDIIQKNFAGAYKQEEKYNKIQSINKVKKGFDKILANDAARIKRVKRAVTLPIPLKKGTKRQATEEKTPEASKASKPKGKPKEKPKEKKKTATATTATTTTTTKEAPKPSRVSSRPRSKKKVADGATDDDFAVLENLTPEQSQALFRGKK